MVRPTHASIERNAENCVPQVPSERPVRLRGRLEPSDSPSRPRRKDVSLCYWRAPCWVIFTRRGKVIQPFQETNETKSINMGAWCSITMCTFAQWYLLSAEKWSQITPVALLKSQFVRGQCVIAMWGVETAHSLWGIQFQTLQSYLSITWSLSVQPKFWKTNRQNHEKCYDQVLNR